MDNLPCPICDQGELELTETRRYLHCSICGHYELIQGDDDYDKED